MVKSTKAGVGWKTKQDEKLEKERVEAEAKKVRLVEEAKEKEAEEEKRAVRLEGQDGGGDDWCPFEPVLGSMVLKSLEATKKTKGGLLLPPQYAAGMGIFGLYRVMRLGPGKILDGGHTIPTFLAEGETILVAKADVAEFTWLGHRFYMAQVDQAWTKVRVEK